MKNTNFINRNAVNRYSSPIPTQNKNDNDYWYDYYSTTIPIRGPNVIRFEWRELAKEFIARGHKLGHDFDTREVFKKWIKENKIKMVNDLCHTDFYLVQLNSAAEYTMVVLTFSNCMMPNQS